MEFDVLAVDRSQRSARGVSDAPVVTATPAVTLARSADSATRRVERLRSLDAFRGLTIAAMILVNNPGTWTVVYPPLEHAAWNGCTPTDLIFPFFLFIIGVATSLAFQAPGRSGTSRRRLYGKIARRTVLIFALGVFLNGFPLFDWSALRIPGVLQRVALCYAGAAIAVLSLRARGQAITAVLLVAGYWLAMILTAGPGGAWSGPHSNLAARIDDLLLHGHLLHDGWDPEGLLGTLPALATTLSGALAACWLRSSRTPAVRAAGLMVVGAGAIVLGLVVNRWCPINKSLWSPSYVLFTGGAALVVLALCYGLIDGLGLRRWATPFVMYGTNPIVAYVLSSLMAKEMLLWRVTRADGATTDLQRCIFESVFLPWASPLNASLLYAASYAALWLGVAALLYRRGVLIKI
jgi:predicted acyltransferase